MTNPTLDTLADLAGFIPTNLDEVTPEWLDEIIASRHPGVKVISAQIGDFFGYKPNKVRVQVEYNEAGHRAGLPTSMIVKGGFKGRTERESLSGLDIGLELELLAYAEVVPHLNVNTPHCIAVRFDPQSYTGVVLIEDIAPSGATFLHQAAGLSYPQAAAFLDAQARFHAQWLDSPEFALAGRFGPESGLGQRTERLRQGYLDRLVRHDHWDAFVALPRGAALPRLLQDAGAVSAAQERMNELHRSCPQTIVHGDEHLGNLYIDHGGNVGFLDWCSRREPWVVAFTYFLLSTLDALDRRKWERPLLAYYLDRLTRHGAAAPSFQEAWHHYRCTALFPFLTWLNNSAKWQPESINTRNTMRAALAVIDHDSLNLLGA